MMAKRIAVLDVVALLVDVPEHGLARGHVGTVVDQLGGGVFEVEFSDEDGRTHAELALGVDVLLVVQNHGSIQR